MATALSPYQELLVGFTPRPIRNEREYRRALRFIDAHMSPRPPKAERDLIELLSVLVSDYEAQRHPARDAAPREVLAMLLDARGVSGAEVARQAGIPRSTLSHVLAGRRDLSRAAIGRLARYFAVDPSVFLPTG